jgi:hypothetical protein
LRRALVFLGAGALLVGLAFLVARPRVPDPATNPYAGVRGGSRAKAAGLGIHYLRDGVDRAVEPATVLRAGDRLRLTVRSERPRHVEVRLRDGDAPPAVVFPAGGGKDAVLVQPREVLPVSPVVAPGGGRLVLTALFSDRPRGVGAPADPDTETVTITVAKE